MLKRGSTIEAGRITGRTRARPASRKRIAPSVARVSTGASEVRAMNDARFSSDDERWPLMAVLTWIATRSLKYTESYAFKNPVDADYFISMAREGSGAPFQISYAASFHSLDEKIETQAIAGLGTKVKWIVSPTHEQLPTEKCFSLSESSEIFDACVFRPQELLNANFGDGYTLKLQDFIIHNEDCFTPKGSGYGFPNPDGSRARWTWKGVTFAREDVLRVWRDWDCFAAWKQAKAHTWRPSKNLSPDWLKNLPPGQYVSLSDVIALLAFGPDLIPIGLDNVEENAARFRAGLALMVAAKESKVTLCGHATFRLPRFPGGIAPVSMLAKIEPKFLADMTLVIDGARDWLGPTRFADEYPEIGQATDSVTLVGVTVHRESLGRWLSEIAGKPIAKKRGPKFKYDWSGIEQETYRLMREHGYFTPANPSWNAQARLEEKLQEFHYDRFGEELGMTQLRSRIGQWLTIWRQKIK
jgi:hypothetical protein